VSKKVPPRIIIKLLEERPRWSKMSDNDLKRLIEAGQGEH